MALIKVKPTSPGRRSLVKVVNPDLHKGRPVDALTESKKRGSGRNIQLATRPSSPRPSARSTTR